MDETTVTRVSVDAPTRAPTGTTNAYVVGTDGAVLIDPPAPSERLDAALSDRDVAHAAVTHHHPDHVGGVARYADRCGATVWGRRGREDAFADATGRRPDRTFAEGTAIPTGDGPVRVRDTPGHAPEHVAFETSDGLVCGDLAVAEGSVVVGAPEGDVRAYLASLRRVRAMAPDRLYPGHGPVVSGGDVTATVERLIAHRIDRERRVREAVEGGARTAEAICDAAYDKDLAGVRDLAEATVAAHLEKLAVEGSVRWDGRRARPA